LSFYALLNFSPSLYISDVLSVHEESGFVVRFFYSFYGEILYTFLSGVIHKLWWCWQFVMVLCMYNVLLLCNLSDGIGKGQSPSCGDRPLKWLCMC